MDQGRNQEINEYIAGTKWKWTHNTTKSLGHIKSSFMREVYSLFPYIKKKSERGEINDFIIQLKILEKQEQSKPQNPIWQEIIKIKIGINKIETKRTL